LLLGLAAGLAGCRPDGGRPPVAGAVSAVPADSISFEILLARQVGAGQPVAITLRLTNRGATARQFYLLGRTITFDILVSRPDGQVVWQRLHGQLVPQILQVVTLEPGQRLDFTDTWAQRTNEGEPVGPGTFMVQGVLPTDERQPMRTALAELVIAER
jgi:hypothetical protein